MSHAAIAPPRHVARHGDELIGQRAGSPAHQVCGFLRHPHLRGGESVPDDTLPGTVRIRLAPIREPLHDRLARGPLRDSELLHVTLAVLSALHYLAQCGWRLGGLDIDDLVCATDDRVQVDAPARLAPSGSRPLDDRDVALATRLLEQLPREPDEERDTVSAARIAAADVLAAVSSGRSLRRAMIDTGAAALAEAPGAQPLTPIADGRRRRRRRAGPALPLTAGPIRRAGALVSAAGTILRVRAALGGLDDVLGRLQRGLERRARGIGTARRRSGAERGRRARLLLVMLGGGGVLAGALMLGLGS